MTEDDRNDFLRWAISHSTLIPDSELEDVQISTEIIPKGEKIVVASMRNAMFMGEKPGSIILDVDYPYQKLSYEGGVWMTNSLQEINQMRVPLRRCTGRTLIGGLGLGIFTHLHSQLHNYNNVTVEKDSRIVKLVGPHIDSGDTISGSLFDFLTTIDEYEFDYAFFDIWQPTGESVWIDYVVPLRRLCRNKMDQSTIYCWNEKEMQGQLLMNLHRYAFVDPFLAEDWAPNWIIAKKGREFGLPILMSKDSAKDPKSMLSFITEAQQKTTDAIAQTIHCFLTEPGTDEWEAEFGDLWDEFVEVRKLRKESKR